MRSDSPSSLFVWCVILGFSALICVFAVSFGEESQAEKPTEQASDGNNECYVCHPSLKTEDITTEHLAIEITCHECHGACTEHMHDEMLMTKPDLLFGRSEVRRMCSDPTCHKPGEGRQYYSLADHKDQVAAEAFFKEWLGRTRPNGRSVTSESVCTDCHGTHNLDKAVATRAEKEETAEWVAVFNGKDLAGWKQSGQASWEIGRGRIEASPAAGGKPGTLWTEEQYEDYRLAMTFRADWPVHAGIWVRSEDSNTGPRVEIFDNSRSKAYTGSVFVPGSGLALLNLAADSVDRESWNTLSVKVEGDKIHVWINGAEVGSVVTRGPAKGRIGIHIEKPAAPGSGRLTIREVLIQKLGEPQG